MFKNVLTYFGLCSGNILNMLVILLIFLKFFFFCFIDSVEQNCSERLE